MKALSGMSDDIHLAPKISPNIVYSIVENGKSNIDFTKILSE
jgi:hypothetical protein